MHIPQIPVPKNVLRIIGESVYIFACAVAIYSIFVPYMTTTNALGNTKYDIYLDKKCIDDKCSTDNNIYSSQSTALYALYLIFIVLSGIFFILSITNKYAKINSYIGLVLLFVALAILITINIVINISYLKLSYLWNPSNEFNSQYNYTPASILICVVCSFVIIKQCFSNDILHSFIKMIFRRK